jgi:hypothetical protein
MRYLVLHACSLQPGLPYGWEHQQHLKINLQEDELQVDFLFVSPYGYKLCQLLKKIDT